MSLPGLKKFESENEIEEKKKKRQEEWERVRQPHEPLEAPEEVYDSRSLYERLEEQRQKKQDEYDEAHKLKNMVRGLESDEVQFLEYVSDRQIEIEHARHVEEASLLAEYKNAVISNIEEEKKSSKKPARLPQTAQPKKSQMALLAGAVKRKGPSKDKDETPVKVQKPADPNSSADNTAKNTQQTAQVIGVLPGLGVYTDSSDSDSSSSGLSDIEEDLTPKKVEVCQGQIVKQ